jgi:hypothetical protein
LLQTCDLFLDRIIASASRWHWHIKLMIGDALRFSRDTWPESYPNDRVAIVAGLLFGLLVFPALRKPSLSGLYFDAPLHEKGRRNINVLVTMLGQVICGEPFAMNHPLSPLNAHIAKRAPAVQAALAELTSQCERTIRLPLASDEIVFKPSISITLSEILNIHKTLFRHLRSFNLNNAPASATSLGNSVITSAASTVATHWTGDGDLSPLLQFQPLPTNLPSVLSDHHVIRVAPVRALVASVPGIVTTTMSNGKEEVIDDSIPVITELNARLQKHYFKQRLSQPPVGLSGDPPRAKVASLPSSSSSSSLGSLPSGSGSGRSPRLGHRTLADGPRPITTIGISTSDWNTGRHSRAPSTAGLMDTNMTPPQTPPPARDDALTGTPPVLPSPALSVSGSTDTLSSSSSSPGASPAAVIATSRISDPSLMAATLAASTSGSLETKVAPSSSSTSTSSPTDPAVQKRWASVIAVSQAIVQTLLALDLDFTYAYVPPDNGSPAPADLTAFLSHARQALEVRLSFDWDNAASLLAMINEVETHMRASGRYRDDEDAQVECALVWEEVRRAVNWIITEHQREWVIRERRLRSSVKDAMSHIERVRGEAKLLSSIIFNARIMSWCRSADIPCKLQLPSQVRAAPGEKKAPPGPIFACSSVETFILEWQEHEALLVKNRTLAAKLFAAFMKAVETKAEPYFSDFRSLLAPQPNDRSTGSSNSKDSNTNSNSRGGQQSDRQVASTTTEEWQPVQRALELIDHYLCVRLFSCMFSSDQSSESFEDEKMVWKIRSLEWVRPFHLMMPQLSADPSQWTRAVESLQRIDTYRSPKQKMACLITSIKWIAQMLQVKSGVTLDADTSLSALIYVVLQARPQRLQSNLAYLETFLPNSALAGEAGFCLTQFSTAVSYIAQTLADTDKATLEAQIAAAAAGHPVTRTSIRPSIIRPPPNSLSSSATSTTSTSATSSTSTTSTSASSSNSATSGTSTSGSASSSLSGTTPPSSSEIGEELVIVNLGESEAKNIAAAYILEKANARAARRQSHRHNLSSPDLAGSRRQTATQAPHHLTTPARHTPRRFSVGPAPRLLDITCSTRLSTYIFSFLSTDNLRLIPCVCHLWRTQTSRRFAHRLASSAGNYSDSPSDGDSRYLLSLPPGAVGSIDVEHTSASGMMMLIGGGATPRTYPPSPSSTNMAASPSSVTLSALSTTPLTPRSTNTQPLPLSSPLSDLSHTDCGHSGAGVFLSPVGSRSIRTASERSDNLESGDVTDDDTISGLVPSMSMSSTSSAASSVVTASSVTVTPMTPSTSTTNVPSTPPSSNTSTSSTPTTTTTATTTATTATPAKKSFFGKVRGLFNKSPATSSASSKESHASTSSTSRSRSPSSAATTTTNDSKSSTQTTSATPTGNTPPVSPSPYDTSAQTRSRSSHVDAVPTTRYYTSHHCCISHFNCLVLCLSLGGCVVVTLHSMLVQFVQ